MGSERLHESEDALSERTREMHRAIASLVEELEAVDWYQQRADASSDPELAAILRHHRAEEVEHAVMILEWIRRRDAHLDEMCKTYLFTHSPLSVIEEQTTAAPEAHGSPNDNRESLKIGSLRAVAPPGNFESA